MLVDYLLVMVTGLIQNTNATSCEMLDRSDYEHIVWTAAAEFPGENSII